MKTKVISNYTTDLYSIYIFYRKEKEYKKRRPNDLKKKKEKYHSLLKWSLKINIRSLYPQLTDHTNVPLTIEIIVMQSFPET